MKFSNPGGWRLFVFSHCKPGLVDVAWNSKSSTLVVSEPTHTLYRILHRLNLLPCWCTEGCTISYGILYKIHTAQTLLIVKIDEGILPGKVNIQIMAMHRCGCRFGTCLGSQMADGPGDNRNKDRGQLANNFRDVSIVSSSQNRCMSGHTPTITKSTKDLRHTTINYPNILSRVLGKSWTHKGIWYYRMLVALPS